METVVIKHLKSSRNAVTTSNSNGLSNSTTNFAVDNVENLPPPPTDHIVA